jgi:rhamnosyltransferase
MHGALIVTYNPNITGLRTLVNTLSSQVTHLVIVDNHSRNVAELLDAFSIANLRVIDLNENKGIAEAQNIGLNYLIYQDCKFTTIFDQDSVVPSGFINELHASFIELDKHNKVASVGPVCRNSESGDYYPTIKLNGMMLQKVFPDKHGEHIEASFLIASGTMVRNEVFKDIGFMRSEFFIDNVDIEWGLRALHYGYKHFATNNVVMEHMIGEANKKVFGRSFFLHLEFRQYYKLRNQIRLLFLHTVPLGYKVRILIRLLPAFILGVYLSNDKVSFIKYSALAVCDAPKKKASL